MSIYEDLERVKLTERERQSISNQLQDFRMLCGALGNCRTPDDVVPYIYLELQGGNRFSYLSRIYGRYRKLLPDRDRLLMQKWRRENGETGK